jgi:hypothetical protein
MALAEQMVGHSSEKKRPNLEVVKSKKEKLTIPQKLKKVFKDIVGGDKYDAELSVDEYSEVVKERNQAKVAKDKELASQKQNELNAVVDQMNDVLRQMVTDELEPSAYLSEEPDVTKAMDLLKKGNKVTLLRRIIKNPNWDENFEKTIQENPSIFESFKKRASKIFTMKKRQESQLSTAEKMEAVRKKITEINEGKEPIAVTSEVKVDLEVNKKEIEKNTKLISKAKTFNGLVKALKKMKSFSNDKGQVFEIGSVISSIESIEETGAKSNSLFVRALPKNYGLREKVVELLTNKVDQGDKQFDQRSMEIAESKSLNDLIGKLSKFDKVVDVSGKEYNKEEILKVLKVLDKKNARPESPLVSFIPNVYGVRDEVVKFLKQKFDKINTKKDVKETKQDIAQMKNDLAVLKQIFDYDGKKKWVSYGDYEYKMDISGVLRYKEPGQKGSGKIAPEEMQLQMENDMNENEEFILSLKKAKGRMSEKERMEHDDAIAVMQEKGISYEEAKKEAQERFSGESLKQEWKDIDKQTEVRKKEGKDEMKEELRLAVKNSKNFHELYQNLGDLGGVIYENGVIVETEEVKELVRKAELSNNKAVRRVFMFKLPKVIRDKVKDLLSEQEVAINSAVKDIQAFEDMLKGQEEKAETKLVGKLQKGEKRMRKDVKKKNEFDELNVEIRALENKVLDLLELGYSDAIAEKVLSEYRQKGYNIFVDDPEFSVYFETLSRKNRKQIKKLSKAIAKLEKKANKINYDFDNIVANREYDLKSENPAVATGKDKVVARELAKSAKDKSNRESFHKRNRDRGVRQEEVLSEKVEKGEKVMKKDLKKQEEFMLLNDQIAELEDEVVDMFEFSGSDSEKKKMLSAFRQEGMSLFRDHEEFSVYFDSLSKGDQRKIKELSKRIVKLERKANKISYDFDNVMAGKEYDLDVVSLNDLQKRLETMTREEVFAAIERKYHVDVYTPSDSERQTISKLYSSNGEFRQMYDALVQDSTEIDEEIERTASKETRKNAGSQKKSFFRRMFGG